MFFKNSCTVSQSFFFKHFHPLGDTVGLLSFRASQSFFFLNSFTPWATPLGHRWVESFREAFGHFAIRDRCLLSPNRIHRCQKGARAGLVPLGKGGGGSGRKGALAFQYHCLFFFYFVLTMCVLLCADAEKISKIAVSQQAQSCPQKQAQSCRCRCPQKQAQSCRCRRQSKRYVFSLRHFFLLLR